MGTTPLEHLPLDHVVIAVPDLAAAMADYRARGFQDPQQGNAASR